MAKVNLVVQHVILYLVLDGLVAQELNRYLV